MIRSVPRAWLLFDIVGSAFGAVVTLLLGLVSDSLPLSLWIVHDQVALALYVCIAVVMWGAAAISRILPAVALALAWGAAIAQMACGFWPALFNVAVFGVLFGSAAWGGRALVWIGAVSAFVSGGVIVAYIGFLGSRLVAMTPIASGRVLTLATLSGAVVFLALVLAWGAGLMSRVMRRGRESREAQLRAEALAAQEQERVRIARDVHDIVAHSLAVVIAQADGARYAAKVDPELATGALVTISHTARGALSDVRMLLTQLRHQQGDGPQPTLADLEPLFLQVRRAGIEPRVRIDPTPPGEPPQAIQLAVYRIMQEALTNAIRHGEGPVDVYLAWLADHVELQVHNSVAPRGGETIGGHGLIGMRERAQLVGGTLQAERRGARFVVWASLPIGGSS